MSNEQYATPILVGSNKTSIVLERLPISGKDSKYDEAFIQNIAFNHPSCLPVTEIDRAYEGLIPVCIELNTPAGQLDVLYVTPKGRLVIVEAKLWRNPEARRKVVGQILDYAKELSLWDYEDLQREVSRSTRRKGNVLFDLVSERYPDTDESEFVDEVTRSLSLGRFLLLILGDGIREGVGAIAQFLEDVGGLEFTLGLVELAIYNCPGEMLLLQPRVLAKTTVFKRVVVSVKADQVTVDDYSDDQEKAQEFSDYEKFYTRFWPNLLDGLKLDDPSQPPPKSTGKGGNIFFPMPPSGGQAWINVYFSQQKSEVGVSLTFFKGSLADDTYTKLLEDQEEINNELGIAVSWISDDGKYKIRASKSFSDLFAEENQTKIRAFFIDSINRFVNVFRSRLTRIAEEI